MRGHGRFIAFEGVDGAGKSTVLFRVAEHLRARGERVFLPRLGKEHDSQPTRMIRPLTRDQRNHPRTSRIRKRIERVRTHAFDQEGGRKGLTGSAFKERVRDFYVSLAEARGYPLFHVERATPDQLEARVLRAVDHGRAADIGESDADRRPQWRVREGISLVQGLLEVPVAVALYLSNGLIAGRALRSRALSEEPAPVAWSLDAEDPLREELADLEPEFVLRELRCTRCGG